MKYISLSIAILLFAVSCAPKDPKAQLEALRKEHATIEGKIRELEAIVGADSSKAGKSKLVEITPLKKGSFRHYVSLQGKVDSDNSINLYAKMPGQIVKIAVREGDVVSKGQVIFYLDSSVIVKGMDELRSGLAFATQVYEKQKSLWDKKIGSEIQYLTAKNQKESLELKLKSLEEQLAMSRITSPINGVVDQITPKEGELAAPGWPIGRVVNLSNFKVSAEVPENYSGKVKLGNPAIVAFPDLGKEITVNLSFVSKVIDPATRSFKVESRLGNNDEDIKPNMVAQLKIADFSSDSALSIPVNLLQKSELGDYVMTAEKSKSGTWIAKRKMVKTGTTYNGQALIESGLNEGDILVTFGYQGLNEGDEISIADNK